LYHSIKGETFNGYELYYHLTGGPDTGLNELDVLNYWRKNPVTGDKILAYAAIDPKTRTNVELAIQLFGGVYLGFQVQQDCDQEFDARKPWTPGPLTNDGHAVFAVAYGPDRRDCAYLGEHTTGHVGLVG
jgi:hypothetical protein